MIVDTSALVAIFADEPERLTYLSILAETPDCRASAGSWIEFGTVLVRRFGVQDPSMVLEEFAAAFDLRIEPVTAALTAVAVRGYATFGRGSRHPANLNWGDCFAYALAIATGEPLLFKGEDFIHTDVTPAI